MRQRVKALVRLGHCDDRYLGKLGKKKNTPRDTTEIWVKGTTEGAFGEAIPLRGLPQLEAARLRLWVITRVGRVEKFNVRLEGSALPTPRPWLVSVELDEGRMGSGACGHALTHCHVGPDHDATPEVRVPCPAMAPWDALDWVLTLVVPDWEPLPWPADNPGDMEAAILGPLRDTMPPDVQSARRAWLARWTPAR